MSRSRLSSITFFPHFTLAVLVFGIFTIAAQAQRQPEGTYSSATPAPAIEARVMGMPIAFEFTGSDMRKAILNHPMPEVWFDWPVSTNQLPVNDISPVTSSMQVILSKFWKNAIAFQFRKKFDPLPTASKRYQLDTDYAAGFAKVEAKLLRERIEAPGGERPLSQNETTSLLRFLTLGSIEIVRQAHDSR
ncbi:MAG: hypothetical protein ABIP75_02425 [Pyrinomonadaceae bacterium]